MCRRITVPLDGSSAEVKVEDLMRDDTSYTSTDMPRVNPGVKVWGSHICSGLQPGYFHSTCTALQASEPLLPEEMY